MNNRFFNTDQNRPNIPNTILALIASNLDPVSQNNLALTNHAAHRSVQTARKRKIAAGETYFAVPKKSVATSATAFSSFYSQPITPSEKNIISSSKNTDLLLFKTKSDALAYVNKKSFRDIDHGLNDTYEYPIFEIQCVKPVDSVVCNLHNNGIIVHDEVLKLDRNLMRNFEISAYFFESDEKHNVQKQCNIF